MPPTAIWLTEERFAHGRGRLFLGNADHALNDEWCNANQVRQHSPSLHAFVVLRVLLPGGRDRPKPLLPSRGASFPTPRGMFCQKPRPITVVSMVCLPGGSFEEAATQHQQL